jgi:serine/threonine protein kinase/tetratricopeptide (TPR) repeat protein
MTDANEQGSNPNSTMGSRHRVRPDRDFVEARSLKRQLVDELRAGWDAGCPVPAEEVLERWPGGADDPDIASLLFEEYLQRCQQGDAPNPAEYERRFPSQRDALIGLARQQDFLRSLGGKPVGSSMTLGLPEVGAQVFGFRLCHELGRGSFARVFLAEETKLAGRPVVVKVSAIDGDEPQTLAQLQHTHIVPIYSVHEDASAGLRAVCMPYFGGASLSRVLQSVFDDSPEPRSGKNLVEALARVRAPACGGFGSPSKLDGQTPLAILSRLDYTQASMWIIARLAEALEHAHQRGVLHRDIKPSNILLGADGEPMLLDFNLAQSQRSEQAQAMATLGGTVAYMAPEHLRALAARDPALARSVDHRADIYGLGMVLFEMLTGRRPFDQSASYSPVPALVEAMALERARSAPSLRALRATTPWSLESIVRKCLAADAAARYQHAGDLAEDLRCVLEDRPLRHAPELSWKERMQKWSRRHPRLAMSGAISAAALVVLGVGTAVLLATLAKLHASQAQAEAAAGSVAREQKRQFDAGVDRARCLVHTTTDMQSHPGQGRAACEETLAIYGILQNDWKEGSAWQRLEPQERFEVEDKARELLLLLADVRLREALVRPAPPTDLAAWLGPLVSMIGAPTLLGSPAAAERGWERCAADRHKIVLATAQEGLELLAHAESLRDGEPSAALLEERANFLDRLERQKEAKDVRTRARRLERRTVSDHYALASALSLQGQYAAAVPELKEALRLDSKNYWAWFHMGICHYELGEFPLALADFRACCSLWPEFPLGHFNSAQVLHRLGKLNDAIDAYALALRCDPNLAIANLNRGLVYLETLDYERALADFDAALAAGLDGVATYGGRGIALEALDRHRQADQAFERVWECDPDNVPMLLGYAFAVSKRLPGRAESVFEKVLRLDSKNPRALYGYAMLSAQKSRRSEVALTCFTLALEADPHFLPARRGRADVLAHRGELAKALEDINWCIRADETGPTLYSAACVYATLAQKCGEPAMTATLTERAVSLLGEAFQRGYGQDRAAEDEDLAILRGHPKFRSLLKKSAKPRNQV